MILLGFAVIGVWLCFFVNCTMLYVRQFCIVCVQCFQSSLLEWVVFWCVILFLLAICTVQQPTWITASISVWLWDNHISFECIEIHKTSVRTSIFFCEVTDIQAAHSTITITSLICIDALVCSFPYTDSPWVVALTQQCNILVASVTWTRTFNLDWSVFVSFFKHFWKRFSDAEVNACFQTNL